MEAVMMVFDPPTCRVDSCWKAGEWVTIEPSIQFYCKLHLDELRYFGAHYARLAKNAVTWTRWIQEICPDQPHRMHEGCNSRISGPVGAIVFSEDAFHNKKASAK